MSVDDKPDQDQPQENADGRLSKWVDENSGMVERTASQYPNWSQAVAANSALSQRMAELAKIAISSVQINPLSEMYGPLASLSAQATGAAFSPLFEEAMRPARENIARSLGAAVGSIAAPSSALRDIFAEQSRSATQLVALQRSLNVWNRPSATRATTEFITETDNLRYRGRRRVWHYTSAQALQHILSSHLLWASSPHHLNDAGELLHGVQLVKEAVERAVRGSQDIQGAEKTALAEVTDETFVSEAMHEIFYISASGAQDSLTLWRNYSASDGFAIGLQPGRALGAEGLVSSAAHDNTDLPAVAAWYKVTYNDSAKRVLTDSFVSSAVADLRAAPAADRDVVVKELRKHLLILASTMKHQAFADEREVRWITTSWAPVDVVHYELTGRGFVPVLHVRAQRSDSAGPHLPVTGLRCSPTTGPTIVRTMTGLLRQRGYDAASTDIIKSEAPFRG